MIRGKKYIKTIQLNQLELQRKQLASLENYAQESIINYKNCELPTSMVTLSYFLLF